MIKFIECQMPGYPARTKENIIVSEATISIATDFKTAGSKLTEKTAKAYSKLYIPVDYNKLMKVETAQRVANLLIENNITSINGAGNGIYNLPEDQLNVGVAVGFFFALLTGLTGRMIRKVRTGGQTGIDEAFLFAAEGQYVPDITCLAPKGWIFRGKDGKDIKDEKLFKERFNF